MVCWETHISRKNDAIKTEYSSFIVQVSRINMSGICLEDTPSMHGECTQQIKKERNPGCKTTLPRFRGRSTGTWRRAAILELLLEQPSLRPEPASA
ncbi:unnamed protein product [Allacma fusca]|uniref:Uncharacterized protein n=1 Tax=Allacma fusca TaxID=39272 RepID=A0A8J2P3V0_9HEXA|nr:unnamed protein product [Allacma fusca]